MDEIPVGLGHLRQGDLGINAGVVNEHVERSELVARVGRRRFQVFQTADVGPAKAAR